MKLITGALVVAGSLGIALARPAFADSLVDNIGPRSIGMGETMRGSAHGALATQLNPAGLALSRQLVFDGSFGFRPDDGALRFAASACDATVPLPGCFYYQYFGASPEIAGEESSRRAHEAGTLFAIPLSDIAFAGVSGKYFDYDSGVPGEDDVDGFALDVGAVLRAGDRVDLGVAGYNLLAADAAQYPRGIGSGITVRPVDQLAVAIDGVWDLDAEEEGGRAGRYGLGAEYFTSISGGQAGLPLRLGGVYDAGRDGAYATAGAGYVTRRLGIDAGARYQVSGGDELIFLVGVRLFGPAVQ